MGKRGRHAHPQGDDERQAEIQSWLSEAYDLIEQIREQGKGEIQLIPVVEHLGIYEMRTSDNLRVVATGKYGMGIRFLLDRIRLVALGEQVGDFEE